jgi:hypothetical protein
VTDEQTEAHWRSEIEQRPARPADAISEAVGTAVAEALVNGQFQECLRARGWALVHVGDGSCPPAPVEWLHDGLDMTLEGWIDPIGRLGELWRSAWLEGNRAGRADTTPG